VSFAASCCNCSKRREAKSTSEICEAKRADTSALLRDPRYSAAFDRKYGKGAARKSLGLVTVAEDLAIFAN